MDSYKGTLSSVEAGNAVRDGLSSAIGPGFSFSVLPAADGGEGTLEALTAPEERVLRSVRDPLFRPITAEYGMISSADGKKTAIVEMARAAGLTLLSENERNAGKTTTYGVGELIADALDRGADRILLTAGGSATNDGGCGMIAALGARFFGEDGPFLPTGGTLARIRRIDFTSLHPRLSSVPIRIAADVKNPLLGENGATAVYGRQKGGSDAALRQIEEGMRHYVTLLPSSPAGIPGSGAAGGLAVPLLALYSARIVPGIDAVLDAVGFGRILTDAALVITGEGRTDPQSRYGKTVCGIAKRAAAAGVPTVCLSGGIEGDREELRRTLSLAELYAVTDSFPLGECLSSPARTLSLRAAELGDVLTALCL